MISALVWIALADDLRTAVEVDAFGQTRMYTSPASPAISDLKFGIVRLQAIVQPRNLMQPWMPGMLGGMQKYVGSGFVVRVDKHGPLIVTNAHVVSDAKEVAVQVPADGQKTYEARAVLVNHDMDIALVRVKSKEILDAKLAVLPLYNGTVHVGMSTTAMGFPLGMTTPKVSQGVLSGHEIVGEFTAYQHTSPISQGNSGGPLLKEGSAEVVGINFATAAGENSQQNNFAIPSWRVRQMVQQYDGAGNQTGATYSRAACEKDRGSCSFKVPKLSAQTSPGTDSLYRKYGCEQGLFVSRVNPESVLAHADPPVESKSFITKVSGIKLDRFGMGRSADYFDDPVGFMDLMLTGENLAEPATVEVCSCGKTTTHEVGLQWKKSMEAAVPMIDEPMFAELDYETFGPVTVQPVNVNLAQFLVQVGRLDLIGYVTDPSPEPALLISDAQTDEGIAPGSIITKLNGAEVRTLQDFRKHFAPTREMPTCANKGGEPTDPEMAAPKHATKHAPKEAPEEAKAAASKHETHSHGGWVLEMRDGTEFVADYQSTLDQQKSLVMEGARPLTKAVKAALKDEGVDVASGGLGGGGGLGPLGALEKLMAGLLSGAMHAKHDPKHDPAHGGKAQGSPKAEPKDGDKAAEGPKDEGEHKASSLIDSFDALPIEQRKGVRRGGASSVVLPHLNLGDF